MDFDGIRVNGNFHRNLYASLEEISMEVELLPWKLVEASMEVDLLPRKLVELESMEISIEIYMLP